jgi:hypothetical protein
MSCSRLEFRIAHNVANSWEVQLHTRVETEDDLVCVRTDELAVLRVYAGLGAGRSLISFAVSMRWDCTGWAAYSALSTTTAASCAIPRGSSFCTLGPELNRLAFLIVLIAAFLSSFSGLGLGREEIRFQTLGYADLSSPEYRFAAPRPAAAY